MTHTNSEIVLELHERFRETGMFELDNVAEVGDHVLLDIHISARGRGSGIPVEVRSSQVWTVRGGKVIRLTMFDTREEVLEWAQTAEPDRAGER
jgi:ketosteroid isomerase-like protein